MDLTSCEITTWPSSAAQKKKQGGKLTIYTFDLSTMPVNHQTRSLYRAIEHWMLDRRSTQLGMTPQEIEQVENVGPRVTFLDEEQYMVWYSQQSSNHSSSWKGQRPQIQYQQYAQSLAMTRSRSGSSMTSSASNKPSKKYNSETRRAYDVGLVWWASDLHGRHL
jgi:hypothetical protein